MPRTAAPTEIQSWAKGAGMLSMLLLLLLLLTSLSLASAGAPCPEFAG